MCNEGERKSKMTYIVFVPSKLASQPILREVDFHNNLRSTEIYRWQLGLYRLYKLQSMCDLPIESKNNNNRWGNMFNQWILTNLRRGTVVCDRKWERISFEIDRISSSPSLCRMVSQLGLFPTNKVLHYTQLLIFNYFLLYSRKWNTIQLLPFL